MKTYISAFKTAFSAENIKRKGTGLYLLSICVGALSPLMLYISRLTGSTRHIPREIHNGHINFIEVALELFCYYFLPLLIILLTARITHLDHKNKGWQLMETLPVQKFGIYFSKFSIVVNATIIAIIAFIVSSVLFVFLLDASGHLSNLAATTKFPIAYILNILLRLIISTLFLSALQYLFSVLFSNFLIPIFIGIIGFSLNTYLNETGTLLSWYPYASLSNVFHYPKGSDLGHYLTYTDYLSIIGCTIFLFFGYYWFKNKNLKKVFIGNKIQMAKTYIVLVSLVGLFMHIQQPGQLKAHHTTVLKGTINSPVNFSTLTVVEPFTNETILTIPISGNRFDYNTTQNISLNNYNIFLDGDHRSKVIFGMNDSIYITSKIDKDNEIIDVTGTRLTENKMRIRTEESLMPFWMEDESIIQNSTLFFNKLEKEMKYRFSELKGFKTVDNYTFRDDYIERYKTLLLAEYHYYVEQFKKKSALLFPDKKVNIPSSLKHLEQPIPYDESLLNNKSYLQTILDQLTKNNTENIDRDSKIFKALIALEDDNFKDKLLFWQLNKSIKESTKVTDVDVLLDTYLDILKNDTYKAKIVVNAETKKGLKKGSEMPFFKTETLDGQIVTAKNLKGVYLVIDVWASWCIPCKKDAPYFEKFALKYTNSNIQFVSISMDENKQRDNWKLRAYELSKTVLQLRSLNHKAFMKSFNIESLPRYMVINPEGKILNLDLPRPSQSNFEPMLLSNL